MGFPLPAENYRGYQEGSLIDRAPNIRGKAFLLAHGMADRNVHFQNSILLSKTLVASNIPFEQHVRGTTFLNGPSTASFPSVFVPFTHSSNINWKSQDVVLRIRTRGNRLVGVDGSIGLWRQFYLNKLQRSLLSSLCIISCFFNIVPSPGIKPDLFP